MVCNQAIQICLYIEVQLLNQKEDNFIVLLETERHYNVWRVLWFLPLLLSIVYILSITTDRDKSSIFCLPKQNIEVYDELNASFNFFTKWGFICFISDCKEKLAGNKHRLAVPNHYLLLSSLIDWCKELASNIVLQLPPILTIRSTYLRFNLWPVCVSYFLCSVGWNDLFYNVSTLGKLLFSFRTTLLLPSCCPVLE